MEIELCGYKVQIDAEDYNRVMAVSWWLASQNLKQSGHVYFLHSQWRGNYKFSLHRFIMGCTHKDGKTVDHINGNTLDNRKSNLRVCTSSENSFNQKLKCTNTSGYKGVDFSKALSKFRARIAIGSKHIHLGYFNTPEEAHTAYCEASKKYHGEFGRTK